MINFRAWLEQNPTAKGNLAERCQSAAGLTEDIVGMRLKMLIVKVMTGEDEYPKAASDDDDAVWHVEC